MSATAFSILRRVIRPGCLIACVLLLLSGWARAEEVAAAHEAVKEGMSLNAPVLYRAGGLAITSSMVLCWAAAAFVIFFSQLATRQIRPIPSPAQNFWEMLVESLYGFLENILGGALVKKTFWFFATIFIFILFSNWFGLLPGVGTVGFGHSEAGHFELVKPLARGGNADLNMTLAMSIIFFVLWTVWGVQSNGPGGFILHIFGPKGESSGFMKIFMIVLFAFVGVLETISIAFRPVSLSFRLYGNVFAGENLLEAMTGMSHLFGWLIALPFYFLELLVGLVQALVFMLLTSVFTALICTHEGGEHPAHH